MIDNCYVCERPIPGGDAESTDVVCDRCWARLEVSNVFVYGTLMRGGGLHCVLDGSRFLGPDRTEERFHLLDLGAYPGVIGPHKDGTQIEGEVWEVSHETLAQLDHVEGHPTLFRRRKVRTENGHLVEIYLFQPNPYNLRAIPSGSWRAHCADCTWRAHKGSGR